MQVRHAPVAVRVMPLMAVGNAGPLTEHDHRHQQYGNDTTKHISSFGQPPLPL